MSRLLISKINLKHKQQSLIKNQDKKEWKGASQIEKWTIDQYKELRFANFQL